MNDNEKYHIYYSLLSYREMKASERLSSLRADIQQPLSSLLSCADLLRFLIDKSNSNYSAMLEEILSQLKEICSKIEKCGEETQLKDPASEIELQDALDKFWNIRTIANRLNGLSRDLKDLPEPVSWQIAPSSTFDTVFLSEAFVRAANHIQADIQVFTRPNELEVPSDIIAAHKLIHAFNLDKVNDEEYLSSIIELSSHPFTFIRETVATLLRHYKAERSIQKLIELLRDESEQVVAHAAESLAHLKTRKAIPALIACLDRKFVDEAYLGWIANALASMPDESALDSLARVLDKLAKEPLDDLRLATYPIAGLRKAIQAIGGAKAHAILKQYFGKTPPSEPPPKIMPFRPLP